MERLTKLIKRLGDSDFDALYETVAGTNADKSAALLHMARNQNLTDKEAIDFLGI